MSKRGRIIVFSGVLLLTASVLILLFLGERKDVSIYEQGVQDESIEEDLMGKGADNFSEQIGGVDGYLEMFRDELEPYADTFYSGTFRMEQPIQQSERDQEGQRKCIYELISKLLNFNYTTASEQIDLSDIAASPSLTKCLESIYGDYYHQMVESHVILSLSDFAFFDEYSIMYDAPEGTAPYRVVRLETLFYCDADAHFFIDYPSYEYGDNSSIYYLFAQEDDQKNWAISGMYVISYTRYGVSREFFWEERHLVDMSEMGQMFPDEFIGDLQYVGTLYELDRKEQKVISGLVNQFVSVMYGRNGTNEAGDLSRIMDILEPKLYEDMRNNEICKLQLAAARDGAVVYPENYHSRLLEMDSLWSTVFCYQKAGGIYYVFQEEIPLLYVPSEQAMDIGYQEGLWNYICTFMVDVGGSQPMIIDFFLVPIDQLDEDALEGLG